MYKHGFVTRDQIPADLSPETDESPEPCVHSSRRHVPAVAALG